MKRIVPGGNSCQRSIWNIGRGSAKIPAHVDASEDAGDGGEKHPKHGEPGVAVVVF